LKTQGSGSQTVVRVPVVVREDLHGGTRISGVSRQSGAHGKV